MLFTFICLKPQIILNSRLFKLRKVIRLGGNYGCVCTCTGKKPKTSLACTRCPMSAFSLKDSFSSTTKPLCFSGQQTEQWPKVAGGGYFPESGDAHEDGLIHKLQEPQCFPSGVSRPSSWCGIPLCWTALFRKKRKVHISIFCYVYGSTWVQNANIHRWKVYFNLWVCYIFFFHHTALQIILVLFLWCVKVAKSQLSIQVLASKP